MSQPNIFSLIFDYNMKNLQDSGRPWAQRAYVGKEFIFEYAAASVVTFLHHNPHLEYQVLTDDKDHLYKNILKYNVPLKNLNLIEVRDMIQDWVARNSYSFWPAIEVVQHYVDKNVSFIKLDNDLTCKKSIDDLLALDKALMWKYERKCSAGRDYWGEKFAAQGAFGTTQFDIWNMGVFGLHNKWFDIAKEAPSATEKMLSVDISPVSRFPESPGLRARVWNASEQTALCYVLQKNNIPIMGTDEWFDHHCYGVEAKKNCITAAEYLKS